MEKSRLKTLILQVKTINFFLILLLLINGAQIYNNIVAYSQQQNTTVQTSSTEPSKDFLSFIFENSLSSMLLSTFIIGIVGVLITKLRNFKKKLDMIEILTKSQIKLKRQAEQREKDFENKYIKSQETVAKQIGDLCTKIDNKTQDLERKIDKVQEEATKALIDYLRENTRR